MAGAFRAAEVYGRSAGLKFHNSISFRSVAVEGWIGEEPFAIPLTVLREHFSIAAMAGWVSLLMPIKTGLLMLIAIYAIQFAADRQLASRFQIPDWYLRLRGNLTPVAVLCLALALIHLVRH